MLPKYSIYISKQGSCSIIHFIRRFVCRSGGPQVANHLGRIMFLTHLSVLLFLPQMSSFYIINFLPFFIENVVIDENQLNSKTICVKFLRIFCFTFFVYIVVALEVEGYFFLIPVPPPLSSSVYIRLSVSSSDFCRFFMVLFYSCPSPAVQLCVCSSVCLFVGLSVAVLRTVCPCFYITSKTIHN